MKTKCQKVVRVKLFRRFLKAKLSRNMRSFLDLYYGRGSEEFETNESFQMIFSCWALLGIKPLKPYGFLRSLHVAFGCICLFMCPVFFAVGFMQVTQNSSMTIILTTLQATLNALGLPLKTFVAYFYIDRLRSVEPIFKSLDGRYQNPHGRFARREHVIQSAHLFVTLLALYFAYCTVSWLTSIFTHTQPLNTWLPLVDWIPHSTTQYWLHFVIEVVYVYFLLINQGMNDVYPAVYIKALRTHIILLADRVSRLGENPELTDEDNYKELIDCVRSHQELLQISRAVGSVFSITIFIQFTIAAAILCVCMLNLFLFADTNHRAITIVYYGCVLMQTLLTCYQASMLEVDCEKLPIAIFHCNWWNMDKRSRRLLIYFLHRAQQEISFVAVKFFKINLGTFLSIAKFSFTLYTFMNQMGVGENIKHQLD
ncbi:odorant receptor 43b-like isoform X1 [Bactrocera dorsalis]|uniref:Odorant receptor n=2 Tax=Bactrocera dorsalis TaxID=27457 RepID=A0ABM3JUA5_BACDO|nr:odorant receptor 43b-like isoform X1 [Bactrocera dorsalis]